jgi:energy-coupling factor transport system substrate-specific component
VRPSPIRIVVLVLANLVGLGAFLWPFLLPAAVGGSAHDADGPVIVLGLLVCLAWLLFVELGRGGMGPKAVALVAVLGAAMVALRLPGFVAGFSAMFIVVLVAGNAFGPGFGWVLGATGTFASGLFVGGIGPWLPFQMVAVGWVGAGAGLVGRRAPTRVRIALLAAYGAVAAFAFGAIMNLWFWPFAAGSSALGWDPGAGALTNLRHYAAFYAVTSAGWDVFGAVGNALAVTLLGRPLVGALDRAARRMNFRFDRVDNGDGSRPGGRGEPHRFVEESPDSAGQDAGENPRRGDPRTVPQRADRPGGARVRVKR